MKTNKDKLLEELKTDEGLIKFLMLQEDKCDFCKYIKHLTDCKYSGCTAGIKAYLDKPIKWLSEEEDSWIKSLWLSGFQFIVRDLSETLYATRYEPEREKCFWRVPLDYRSDCIGLPELLFPFVTWDDEPVKISEMLGGDEG